MIYARSGMKGANVQTWQKAINGQRAKIGFDKLIEDGIFGTKTLSATIATQKWLGVTPDGVVGESTKLAWQKKVPFIPLAFYDPKKVSKDDIKMFESSYKNSLIKENIVTPKPIFKQPFTYSQSVDEIPVKQSSFIPFGILVVIASYFSLK